MPIADAVRIGLVEEIVHDANGERRTYRRPTVPLAPRSIQMICRALAQILDAAVLDGLLKANPARGKHMAIKLPQAIADVAGARDEVLSVLDAAAEIEAEDAAAGSPLTARGVKELAAEGLTPAVIAPQVKVSKFTVYYHLKTPVPRPRIGPVTALLHLLVKSGVRIDM